MENKILIVAEENENTRLDLYLRLQFEDKSRSFLQGLIEKESIKVNGKLKKCNYKLKKNDKVEIEFKEPIALEVVGEDIPLDVLYEDSDVIVVNKPKGMVVHPAIGNTNGTLVNALLNHCKDLSGINGVIRPGIVHRIDKDTSGILIVAKNDFAHNKLAEQFKDHSIVRLYTALTEGIIKSEKGTIDEPLGRHPVDRLKVAIVKDGRRAVTHFKVLERFNANTLIQCQLETGRTHQIRVHMNHIGYPLVGDLAYGLKKQKIKIQGQLLHAKTLGFIHPTINEYMEFESPLPDYFEKIVANLRKQTIK